MRDFRLSDKFVESYKDKPVPWGYEGLSFAMAKDKYCGPTEDDRIEEWFEATRRVVEGTFSAQKDHCKKNGLEWIPARAQKTAQIMFDKIFNLKFTPPGRGMANMGGAAVERLGSAPLQNCGFTSTKNIHLDLLEPFVFLMDMSMLGVGIGFDTRGAGKVTIQEPKKNGSTLVIDDSREGWIEAMKQTINAYNGGSIFEFDYSKIRPKGALIKTFGTAAPGPQPLIDLVGNLHNLLSQCVGYPLSSVAITDIMNFIGKAVVSGNVRRSAELAIGAWDDIDFIEMKNWKKFQKECDDRRWASNNSVLANIGMDYTDVAERIAINGEPGVIWLQNVNSYGRLVDGFDDTDEAIGYNPCVEQPLEDKELCTLVECYPANHDTPEEFIETLKYAYMYAKSVTLIPTHNPKSNAVMAKNRRIGTSLTGIEQAITKFGKRAFFEKFCSAGYKEITRWDKVYSNWLGIPRSIRKTTVKPSGTVSLLAGATPGIHKPIAKRYIRYVKYDKQSPFLPAFQAAGYIIEDDLSDKTSKCVLFPIEETRPYRYTEQETNIWEQFQMAADMQHYWSDNGVSCTVKFDMEKEANQIADCLATYETRLKAISLLPKAGHRYKQSPYTMVSDDYEEKDRYVDGHRVIWTNKEFNEYKRKIRSAVLVREIGKVKASDRISEGEKFCSNDQCELVQTRER